MIHIASVVRIVAAWPLVWLASLGPGVAAAAEPADKLVRIGVVSWGPRLPMGTTNRIVKELEKYGYAEGRNLVVEYRQLDEAGELPALRVDVIIAVTNPAAFVAQRATRTIPTVVWGLHGAVETGLVSSLRRPGGNLTGVESLAPELDAKRLELLRQIVPDLARVAVLSDAGDQGTLVHLKSTRAAAQALGITVSTLEVRRAEDFAPVLAAAAAQPLGGLLTYSSLLTFAHWKPTVEFALAQHLPTLCEFRELVLAGCLLSYGATFAEMSERAAGQVARILKGAAAGELPVEQVTRFELVVNLKTAKAIGVTIPQSVLLRADEVIQ